MKHAANSCRQYCQFALMWLRSLYLQALVTFVTFVTHWTRWTLGVFGSHIHGQLSINFVPLEDHCQSNWITFFYLEQVSQVSEGAVGCSWKQLKQRFPSHRSIHANVTLHSNAKHRPLVRWTPLWTWRTFSDLWRPATSATNAYQKSSMFLVIFSRYNYSYIILYNNVYHIFIFHDIFDIFWPLRGFSPDRHRPLVDRIRRAIAAARPVSSFHPGTSPGRSMTKVKLPCPTSTPSLHFNSSLRQLSNFFVLSSVEYLMVSELA